MAIIYSLKKIADIDHRKLGILNKFYQDVDGYIYRGLRNGTLFKYAKCNEVSIVGATPIQTTVCDVLNSLNSRVTILEEDDVIDDAKALMKWEGAWDPERTYLKDCVVRDDEWTMIANKETDDRPAPQPIGSPFFPSGLGDFPTWDTDSVSEEQILRGARYLTPAVGYTLGYRVWAVPGNTYRVLHVTDPLGVPIFEYSEEFTVSQEGWITVALGQVLVLTFTVFDVLLVISPGSPTVSQFFAPWDYKRSNGDALPGEANHQNSGGGDEIRFNIEDDDSNDQSVNLATVNIGDTFTNGTLTWEITDITLVGDNYRFGVNPAARDSENLYTFTFTVTDPEVLTWVEIPDLYLPNLFVAGLTSDDGYDNVVTNDVGYGVDVLFQEAYVSNDWELVAVSGGSSGGIPTFTPVFTEAVTLTVNDSGQNFVINSGGTLLANDAASINDSTKGGTVLGHGSWDAAGFFFDVSLVTEPVQAFFKCVYDPNNNGNMGIEIRAYTDKTNIPGSLIATQTSGYKIVRGGNNNEMTVLFHYEPSLVVIEAFQIFGVAQNNETVALQFFVFFMNKLAQ